MVCIRKHLDSWGFDKSNIFPGRLSGCFLRAAKLGVIKVFSVYLQDQVHMNELNRRVLNEVWSRVAQAGTPFLLGGDFSMPADLVSTYQPLDKFGAVMRAPATPALLQGGNSSTIDYFVLSRALDACDPTLR
eukprot:290018-Pyramimonas_sp.AAC.1